MRKPSSSSTLIRTIQEARDKARDILDSSKYHRVGIIYNGTNVVFCIIAPQVMKIPNHFELVEWVYKEGEDARV